MRLAWSLVTDWTQCFLACAGGSARLRWPGCAPGGAGTFLCSAKEKYPKERRPCCLRPRRCWGSRGAQPRCSAAELAARHAAPLKQPRRVSLDADVSFGTPACPRVCAPWRRQKGGSRAAVMLCRGKLIAAGAWSAWARSQNGLRS